MALHSAEVAGSNHVVHNFVYANAAARNAAVLAATDIGKMARQTDNNSFWILQNDVGPVWTEASYNAAFPDNVFFVQDNGDATKQLNVELAGATGGTTSTIVASQTASRSITLPDATTTLVGTAFAQTLSSKTIGDALIMTEIATPANPAAGFLKFYGKGDSNLYQLDSTGVETNLTAGGAIGDIELWMSGDNGYGSTDTKIRRFTTEEKNAGFVYTNTATEGLIVTIPSTGVYAITWEDRLAISGWLGLSLNAAGADLTTNIYNITSFATRKASITVGATDFSSQAQFTGRLTAGDFIRPHGDGAGSSATPFAFFRIVRIA